MTNNSKLSQFKFDIWLIDQLQHAAPPGLTLEELRSRWMKEPSHKGGLSRDMLTAHRKSIREFLGLRIEAKDRLHYSIINPENLKLDTLANDLLKSIQNSVFLQEYKELGNLIQPEQIETGACYLQKIGRALAEKRKLRITYHKFMEVKPYDAIIHPYCLKADKGRWYIFAHKEGSEHHEFLQSFALDRTKQLEMTSETFTPNPAVDLEEYFRDCFGVWHNYEEYPVTDVTISCTEKAANYLRTLPLHHSQKEDPIRDGEEGRIIFHYHISPTPDFEAELAKWGENIRRI